MLGLSSIGGSILFILAIPRAFFGAWFAGRPTNKRSPTVCGQVVFLLRWDSLMIGSQRWAHYRLTLLGLGASFFATDLFLRWASQAAR
ncbi:hypothetical protein LAD77_00725 [Klebsiella pneumoniae]|nr:hypothetical protein [Klebsiella pneumoniae]